MSATVLLAGCSDLANSADATVTINAKDRAQALRLRQELLEQASTWGGVRVGERSTEQEGDVSLTFSLPGRNLDAALGAINRLDAEIDSTKIDVDRDEVDRTATTAAGTPSDQSDGDIKLKVQIDASQQAGPGALLRLVMALFSVIGMVATVMWIGNAWRKRFPRPDPPGPRRVGVVDISDPPTQETPRVPRNPWN